MKILQLLNGVNRIGIKRLISFLKKSDYFTAPCSTHYHLNISGGLAQHSLNVYHLFKEKNKRYNLKLSNDSVALCALLHDLCKIGFYKDTKDTKDTIDRTHLRRKKKPL